MWLKFAQDVNEEEILTAAEQELSQSVDSLFSVDESLTQEELQDRADRLFKIQWRIYEKLTNLNIDYSKIWEALQKVRKAVQTMQDLSTIRSGRTIYDGGDPYIVHKFIQEMIQHDEMSSQNIEYILEDIRELESRGIPSGSWSNGFQRHIRLRHDQKNLIDQSMSLISNYILANAGINIPDKQDWKVMTANSLMKRIDGQSILSENENDENEYPTLTFIIDKAEGISIYAEVGETDADASRISFNFQKQELQNFLQEVNDYFPSDWNKQITDIGDEGDFRRILETNPNDSVKLFRMMSFDEYRQWEIGETIPVGKYFATKRSNASGTDFGSEGDRDIFSFIGIQRAFRGDFGGNLVSVVPMKMQGKKLVPEE